MNFREQGLIVERELCAETSVAHVFEALFLQLFFQLGIEKLVNQSSALEIECSIPQSGAQLVECSFLVYEFAFGKLDDVLGNSLGENSVIAEQCSIVLTKMVEAAIMTCCSVFPGH